MGDWGDYRDHGDQITYTGMSERLWETGETMETKQRTQERVRDGERPCETEETTETMETK